MTEITDQMIEAAARAIARNWGLDPDDHIDHEHFHEDAIAALEAVAPLIRAAEARSIAKACDELARMAPSSVGMVADLLHSRADKLEREAGQ